MSYPGVYNMYSPYHKRGLMGRAFLFFDGQVQSLAYTHVGSSPIVDPFFWTDFWLFAFFRRAPARTRHAPRCALIASIRHAVQPSPPFDTLCTHSLGVGILPISHPGVYNMYAPYGWTGHKSGSGFSDLAPSILHYNWF
jgi:hypothetical protein